VWLLAEDHQHHRGHALRGARRVPALRGYLADMGRSPTHKAAIVRLYLQGLTTPDIAARTAHSKQAVDRYLRDFERVRLLAGTYAREELPCSPA
jgi:DNA-directed RNA polymerase specialized sigma24 family protein